MAQLMGQDREQLIIRGQRLDQAASDHDAPLSHRKGVDGITRVETDLDFRIESMCKVYCPGFEVRVARRQVGARARSEARCIQLSRRRA